MENSKMSDKMRWRYGDTNPVVAAVDAATAIEIGDLVFQDTDDAKPASLQSDQGSEPLNQELFAGRFLGVAMQRSREGDTNPIRGRHDGRFRVRLSQPRLGTGRVGRHRRKHRRRRALGPAGRLRRGRQPGRRPHCQAVSGSRRKRADRHPFDRDDRRSLRHHGITPNRSTRKGSHRLQPVRLEPPPNPDPRIPTPEPRTPNPKPRTPNPESQTPNPESRIPDPEPRIPNPKPRIPNPGPRIPNPEPSPETPPVSTIKYRELRRRYELDGPCKTVKHLSEALAAGDLRPEDFSLRDLAEGLVPDGHAWVRSMDPRTSDGVRVLEASDGVDVTAFLNVAGQVIYSKILAGYTQEAFVISRLVDTIPTRLDGEKIPGIGRLRDEVEEVHPGMPYPNVGFGEDYIETPSTAKRGLIVPVTREAIFFDRTNLVLSRAAEVGELLGLNKEKRLVDLVIGATNNYKWKGTAYDTYYADADGGPWVNALADNELVDWTDVDNAEQLFAEIVDPNTGEPVLVKATTVLVMPAYRCAAHPRVQRRRDSIYRHRCRHDDRCREPVGQLSGGGKPSGLSSRRRVRRGDRRRPQMVVPRRLQKGVCLHGELADHGHAVADGQRGRFQPGRPRAVQSQRTRRRRRAQPALRRQIHRPGGIAVGAALRGGPITAPPSVAAR